MSTTIVTVVRTSLRPLLIIGGLVEAWWSGWSPGCEDLFVLQLLHAGRGSHGHGDHDVVDVEGALSSPPLDGLLEEEIHTNRLSQQAHQRFFHILDNKSFSKERHIPVIKY